MPRRARNWIPPAGEEETQKFEAPSASRRRDPSAPPGEGFQGWSERDEVQLQYEGPQAPDPERLAVEVRVVYLGNKRHHSIPLSGALLAHVRDDGSPFQIPAPKQAEGLMAYNFDRVDERGRSRGTAEHPQRDATGTVTGTKRLPFVRRTEDDRPYAICRHIEHAAWFMEKTDKEGNPEYVLRAPTENIKKIREYIERRQRAARLDPDSPQNVLKQIPAAAAWAPLGGPIGEQLA